ncbi:hypothetical protein ACFFQW_20710 [Umezawaea endophytica]|uniref:Secreted protein n=1 Tax=Umezawaea endophytica TaxID=1654476 RepID=A0A9X2VQA4_9PSEU|nr:hypothetical protein [Umezawaea endophytica]MCS7480634.1 hypothetical protein [Umezawaea endophytica]
MRIRLGAVALAGCAAVLGAVAQPAAAGTVVGERLTCASDLRTTGPLEIVNADWTYVYTLSWCVLEGRIVDAEHVVEHVVHTSNCTWAGRKKEEIDRGVSAWKAFDMSEFVCVGGDGKTEGVNPWVDVTFYPDGHFDRDGGVARSAR